MKKLLVFLLLGMFLISFASAWTSSEFTRDEIKSLDKLTNFGTYEIKESAWYDPLKIWTDKEVATAQLSENGCDENGRFCQSIIPIELKEAGQLIQGRRFYKNVDGEWKLSNVRWSKLEYWGEIIDYQTQCVDGETIYNEDNETKCLEYLK